MNKDVILIVEDSNPQRLSLHASLQNRGFEVASAGDVKTARSLIEKHRDNLGLLVLDMRLEDPEFPNITGADLGIEVKMAQREYPPEFLINSAYSESSYYKLSLALGAAAFLHKKDTDPKQMICHIRALMLRRALKDAGVVRQIRRILSESKGVTEAVVKFCGNVLDEKFKNALGMPVVFLLTVDHQTQCCGESGQLPKGPDPTYDKIQAFAFAEVRGMNPVKIDTSQMPREGHLNEDLILAKLDGAAFLPISLTNGISLSIGLLLQNSKEFPLFEDAQEMAGVLAQYLKNEMLEPLLYMIMQWRVEEARAEAKREEMLRSTSNLCFYVGVELLATLDQSSHLKGPEDQRLFFDRLKAQAIRLRDEGKILASLTYKAEEQASIPERVMIAEFVREVIHDLGILLSPEAITIEGDCALRATREDLLIIISRLLRWFAERFEDSGMIHVRCIESGAGVEIIFEDRSTRLTLPLRERIFFPSSMSGREDSLYLVKTLVEMKYLGSLVDQTEMLPDNVGHRFVIYAPST